MKYKIVKKYMNITNYPYVESFLNEMAKDGYILKKIILTDLFIFEKVGKNNMKYKIIPEENESAFSKKTKSEIENFNKPYIELGWNNIYKSNNLFVYSKEFNDSDENIEDFPNINLLENYISKELTQNIILIIAAIILLSLNIIKVTKLKLIYDGLIQIYLIVMASAISLCLNQILYIYKFKKLNKNTTSGDAVIFLNENKSYVIISHILYISFLLLILQNVFLGILFKDLRLIIIIVLSFFPILIGTILRYTVKPSKSSGTIKFFIILISVLIFLPAFSYFRSHISDYRPKNVEALLGDLDYKVVTLSDLKEDTTNESVNLKSTNISLFSPISYTVLSSNESDFLYMDYIKLINSKLADRVLNLVLESHPYNENIDLSSVTLDAEKAYFLNENKSSIIIKKSNEIIIFCSKDSIVFNKTTLELLNDKL